VKPRAASAPSLADTVRRKLTVAVIVKLLAVFALFLLFFGPAQRPDVDPAGVRDRFVAPTADHVHGERP
jgi:hypothetical protein